MRVSKGRLALAVSLGSLVLGASGCPKIEPPRPLPPGHAISGNVMGAAAGVTITLSGAFSTTVSAGADGTFTIPNVSDGAYTLTPSLHGYTFSPASCAVMMSGADVAGQNFTAIATGGGTHAVSGTVSGAATGGVTITLSGTNTGSATASDAGLYSFTGLADGAYTVTASKAGYTFSPLSRAVTISGSDVGGQDFTASPATGTTYTVSGDVVGPWVEGVMVTLRSATGVPSTTTTSSSGHYSFTGVPAGQHSVSPALEGYAYSPATANVVVTTGNVTQNFSAASVLPTIRISGSVVYGGTPGRVYIEVHDPSCGKCSPIAGTSIAAPGPFTVRGVPAGTVPVGSYSVSARLDRLGQGRGNASDPVASTAVTGTGGDVSGVSLVLAGPTPFAPIAPALVQAYAGDESALLLWDVPRSADTGLEIATDYQVSWGTDASATNGGVATVSARDDAHYLKTGLANGSLHYFKVKARVGAAESAWSAIAGPVPIGAVGGGFTLSGTVSFAAAPTGPLYVGALDVRTNAVRFARIAAPASPQPYAVTGLLSGTYYVFAFIDQNGSGVIDDGDVTNTNGGNGPPIIPISSSWVYDVALPTTNATVSVTTEHVTTAVGEGYGVNLRVATGLKRPVAVTLYSDQELGVPADVPLYYDTHQLGRWFGATRPAVGDTYRFKAEYSDGTSELLAGTLDTVLDAFPRALTVDTGAPYSPTVPLFQWADPLAPPPSFTYQLWVRGSDVLWWYPDGGGMPSTQHAVQFNVDGRAGASGLTPGVVYEWAVALQDPAGNRATALTQYAP